MHGRKNIKPFSCQPQNVQCPWLWWESQGILRRGVKEYEIAEEDRQNGSNNPIKSNL